MIEQYKNQVRLLLKVLPIISDVKYFALKGGTAINFFWRDFPRLSVDIDLTYLPIKKRNKSLQDIKYGVQNIAEGIVKNLPGSMITIHQSGGTLSKIFIKETDAQVKIEVNTVLRGSLFNPVERELSVKVQDEFELFTAIQALSLEDLYGIKFVLLLIANTPETCLM